MLYASAVREALGLDLAPRAEIWWLDRDEVTELPTPGLERAATLAPR
jgi:hypothetical protein